MENIKPNIEASWGQKLKDEFNKPYFQDLKSFLKQEKQEHTVFPLGSLIFSAFSATPFDKVKVVILGQDPYHGVNQAHGLCFSVSEGVKQPPSLMNIFKELNADLGVQIPNHGYLMKWAEQGVLLLNATLTVRAHQAGSHQGKGWETFTDQAIRKLSEDKTGLVFLLWGSYAQNKTVLIDQNKHYVLSAAHPSPFSAYRGFFGCKHFSKTNELLEKQGKSPIEWSL